MKEKYKIKHFQALLILGIESGASDKDLKSAYRLKAKQYHPDKGGTHDEFVLLKQAYDMLVAQGTTEKVAKPRIVGIDFSNNYSTAGMSVDISWQRANVYHQADHPDHTYAVYQQFRQMVNTGMVDLESAVEAMGL